MAAAETSGLSSVIKKFSGSAGDFKQSANDNNKNLSRIAKDLYSSMSSHKKDMSNLSSSISESLSAANQTSAKIDSTNSLLQQSIQMQSEMLSQLKTIASYMKSSTGKDGENSTKSLLGQLTSLLTTGAKVATAGALGAGAASSSKDPQTIPFSPGGGNVTFGSLSEDQKSAVLAAQAKSENVRPALNNPGGMMFSKGGIAEKYGATPGSNNGTITLAQFPTPEAGKAAQRALWESSRYKDLPLEQAVRKWTTGKTDSTSTPPAYIDSIFKAAGASRQQTAQAPGGQGGQITPPTTDENNNTNGGARQGGQGGLTTLTTPISKQSYQVATEYAANFKGFVDELENSGYRIKPGGIGGYRSGGGQSWHGKGMAIDINPDENPMIIKTPDGRVINKLTGQDASDLQNPKYPFGYGKDNFGFDVSSMAAKYGLGWGGNWQSSSDSMHFSAGPNEGGHGDHGGGVQQQGGSPQQANMGTQGGMIGMNSLGMGGGMGSQTLPFQPGMMGMGGIGGFGMGGMGLGAGVGMLMGGRTGGLIGGLVDSVASLISTPQQQRGPIPQSPPSSGNLTPTYAQPGSNEDTAANFFAADKANTAKMLQQKATETAALRETADQNAAKPPEPQKTTPSENQPIRQASINPGIKSDDHMFGKGNWASDALRYYGINNSAA